MPTVRARWLTSSAARLPSTTGSGAGSVAPGPVMPRKNLTGASLGQRQGLWAVSAGMAREAPCRCDAVPL